MPQFDQVAFFNQVFWFFLCFFLFYFITVYFFLPFLCANLKARKKKYFLNKQIYKNNQNDYFLYYVSFNNFFKQIDLTLTKLLINADTKFNNALSPFKLNLISSVKFKQSLQNLWLQLITFSFINRI